MHCPRGCARDKYMYELMREFEENKSKYEPLNGFTIYVKRVNFEGPVKVLKLVEENNDLLNDENDGPVYSHYYPYNDDTEEHKKKDRYHTYFDNSIKVQYLGTDVDLGIREGEHCIICRKDDGELYVFHKATKNSMDFLKIISANSKPAYMHHEPYSTQINWDGSLHKPVEKPTYDWM